MPDVPCLSVLFPPKKSTKNRALLYKPVLVCTIDHIMAATETRRGGKYMLPLLRLMSSDLVIDEVDDFDPTDLVAITRLVHLAGMLGRKVMISSATIPPALAQGFFHAYWAGWRIHTAFKQSSAAPIHAMWVDEFKTRIAHLPYATQEPSQNAFQAAHTRFIEIRALALRQQPIKHLAYIIPCADLLPENTGTKIEILESKQEAYFERIREHILQLHTMHHSIDLQTGKKVSFGVVRVANIGPCAALTQYLLRADWPSHSAPRIMAYHSRQILLLRSEQECHLDAVLNRKEKPEDSPAAFAHPIIRAHLDEVEAEHVLFILVATPVEEVGRDHDFDWAIIEPSSYRSIIQLAGRVWRHRDAPNTLITPNIAILQYNLKALQNKEPAFAHPGYEKSKGSHFHLKSKDMVALLGNPATSFPINAIPRIQAATALQVQDRLADLEHAVLHHELTNTTKAGASSLNGWLKECWWLTALPLRLKPFRKSQPQIQLCAEAKGQSFEFCIPDGDGAWLPCTQVMNIHIKQLDAKDRERLWLKRDYVALLTQRAEQQCTDADALAYEITKQSHRYGELMLPEPQAGNAFHYSDDLGLIKTQNN
ncbi:hypothetical protein [Snodgrassella sp. CFCC 13594]|uniref:hypothetical protein n=1 Tax=Snodgrassella sp. CFCC 13594 TaxID=1775559 RepID=UPI0018D4823B|nr:hypothetical protein [Snodgrassella sp. CFCC 13594]